MVYSTIYHSPIGPLWLTSDGQSLIGLWMHPVENTAPSHTDPVLLDTAHWLDRYFRGERPPMDALHLSPAGTAFQKLIWEILLAIPFGATRTYGEIAKDAALRMGKEKMSAQAVGGAVGRNPISIIIPCHRVVGTGGKLTGYAGGVEKKEWLLRHEEEHK